MSGRSTAEIVAETENAAQALRLELPGVVHAHFYKRWREVADRLAELDAEVDKRILERAELWKRYDQLGTDYSVAVAHLRTLDALRLACPTCGGTQNYPHLTENPCEDCVDGRMSHERAWKIVAVLFGPGIDADTDDPAFDRVWRAAYNNLRGVQ